MRAVLVRADADPFMGTGHVMRCLALAEALADVGVQSHFAAAAMPPALEERLRVAGMATHCLNISSAGGRPDLDATRGLIAALGVQGLVIDGYHFDSAWRAELASGRRLRVLTFDDLAVLPDLHADVVVNPSPAAWGFPYDRIAPGARLLLGPDYAPLRREIRDAKRLGARPFEQRRAVLLTFGGSDPQALTIPCLERLAAALPDGDRVIVVVGPGNPRKDEILQTAAVFGDRVEAHYNCADMGALMNRAGLAISAGGGTIGELAALGAPALVVVVADNQSPAAGPAAATGWCRVIDAREADVCDRIVETAIALWRNPAVRKKMSEQAQSLVDAQGAIRIAEAFMTTPSRQETTPP